jgi:hypothetical protein
MSTRDYLWFALGVLTAGIGSMITLRLPQKDRLWGYPINLIFGVIAGLVGNLVNRWIGW